MKPNNIMIYLKKDNFEKYEELTRLMEIPLSSFIAQILQTEDQMKMIDNMLTLAKATKEQIEKINERRK